MLSVLARRDRPSSRFRAVRKSRCERHGRSAMAGWDTADFAPLAHSPNGQRTSSRKHMLSSCLMPLQLPRTLFMYPFAWQSSSALISSPQSVPGHCMSVALALMPPSPKTCQLPATHEAFCRLPGAARGKSVLCVGDRPGRSAHRMHCARTPLSPCTALRQSSAVSAQSCACVCRRRRKKVTRVAR